MSEYFRKYIKKEHFPLHYSEIKFKTYFNNCIQTVLSDRNYKQTEQEDWNIYWCQKHLVNQSLDKMRLFPNKRINHFRNYLLSKNIKKHKKALEKQGKADEAAGYSFMPLTYNLPSQYPIFNEQFKRVKDRQKAVWIMKPIGASQAKGIFLFRNIADIEQWSQMKNQAEPYIVQRYIHNPLLIGHKKFDLRIYVLVTSHNNLTIYLYRSGFARFTHCRYDPIDINKLDGHVTNVAVQKNSDNYDDQRGGKYQLDKLKIYLISKFGQNQANSCFFAIQELIIKTLQACSKLIVGDKRCFQLYGFDILIDQTLKPWLIEINGSPSMTANTEVDRTLKIGLLDDVLTIVNLQQLLTGDEQQIGGFDMIFKTKRIKQANKNFSMLGCFNDRHKQMRKMAKTVALKQAQKQKQTPSSSSVNPRNKSTFSSSRNNAMSNNISVKSRVTQNSIKLPKVVGNSNKTLNDIPKRGNQMFRITNSKETRKI